MSLTRAIRLYRRKWRELVGGNPPHEGNPTHECALAAAIGLQVQEQNNAAGHSIETDTPRTSSNAGESAIAPAAPDSTPCLTCNDDPAACATVPGLRHCEKAMRESARVEPIAVSEKAMECALDCLSGRHDPRFVSANVAAMARELLRLHAALPAVVQDAERYRWLRNYVGPGDIAFFKSGNSASIESISEETDAAIDSARSAK